MMMTPPRRQPSASSPRAGKGSSGGTGTMNATVSLRLRPVISALDEEQGRRHSAVEVTDKDAGFAAYEGRQFKYSHVFDETASQSDIFQAHRAPVLNVLKGFDATIMAYGSTGAGKTHTCQGDPNNPGLISRAFDEIFQNITHLGAATDPLEAAAEAGDDNATPSADAGDGDATPSAARRHVLQVSALEILEDQCVDLLHERAAIVLRTASDSSLHFGGLREVEVGSRAELDGLVETATQARTVAANYKHDGSSRSHFVLRLRVDSALIHPAVRPTGSGADASSGRSPRGPRARRASMNDACSAVLTLVDLAGSEAALQNREKSAVAQGITINKSLHWLKKVVHDLAARRQPQLRNSPLTRLLAPSLTGGAHVAIIVCSSALPPSATARDTLDCLSFGEAAGYVQLSPRKHTEVSVSPEKLLGPPIAGDDDADDGDDADDADDADADNVDGEQKESPSTPPTSPGKAKGGGSRKRRSELARTPTTVIDAPVAPLSFAVTVTAQDAATSTQAESPATTSSTSSSPQPSSHGLITWRAAALGLLVAMAVAAQQWLSWRARVRAEEEEAARAAAAAAAAAAAEAVAAMAAERAASMAKKMAGGVAMLLMGGGWALTRGGSDAEDEEEKQARLLWERRDRRLSRTGER